VSRAVTATAHANIALVKYWGKRDAALNLPAAGSLSLTLDALTTTTTVVPDDGADDRLVLDGAPAPEPARARVSAWLDLVRARAGDPRRALVTTTNDFPTASGLASSASAFAALALAAPAAYGLALDARAASVLARRGSGSAARSIHGGLVELRAGARADGEDAHAIPLDDTAGWPLRMVIAIVDGGGAKAIGSTEAMARCAATSPLYAGWLATVPEDLAAARAAIVARDLPALGEVTERSALAMHAAAIASRPAIVYWAPATLAARAAVLAARAAGAPGWATMDAGPHVKVLTLAAHADALAATLAAVPGVTSVRIAAPGGPARVIDR
jgi:diphosphomevalonate decarboxylase